MWEKKILGREKNVFKGSEAGSWNVQEIVDEGWSEWKSMRFEWDGWSGLSKCLLNHSKNLYCSSAWNRHWGTLSKGVTWFDSVLNNNSFCFVENIEVGSRKEWNKRKG